MKSGSPEEGLVGAELYGLYVQEPLCNFIFQFFHIMHNCQKSGTKVSKNFNARYREQKNVTRNGTVKSTTKP